VSQLLQMGGECLVFLCVARWHFIPIMELIQWMAWHVGDANSDFSSFHNILQGMKDGKRDNPDE
jgi:hypothetical protein